MATVSLSAPIPSPSRSTASFASDVDAGTLGKLGPEAAGGPCGRWASAVGYRPMAALPRFDFLHRARRPRGLVPTARSVAGSVETKLRFTALGLALTGVLGVACKSKAEPEAPPSAVTKAAAPSEAVCFLPFDASGDPSEMTVAGVKFERRGSTLAADISGPLRLGVIGNTKEFTPAVEQALAAYVTHFREKKVQAIVVTGDIAETEEGVEKVLAGLAKAEVPLLALMGNRDGRAAFSVGVAKVPAAVHLGEFRSVRFGDHVLVPIPGYHDPSYLHAEDGCQFAEPEVAEATKAIDAAGDRTVVLVSHAPPRMTAEAGIDIMLEGDHVGSRKLAALVEAKNVRFGVASNIQESGGRGSDRKGETAVEPGSMADELFFNPGGADPTPWKMLSGDFSYGQAGVVTFEAGKASFEVLARPAPTE